MTAQTNNRETQAEGIGWELFKNYLIAKEKWNPDYFIYENNKSAAEPIKAQIRKELGVHEKIHDDNQLEGQLSLFDEDFDNGVRFTYINSALVSAQNRQRFYVTNFGDIEQPKDRGILLKDVLDGAVALREKGHAILQNAGHIDEKDFFERAKGNLVGERMKNKSNAMQTTNDFYQYIGYAIEFEESGKPVKAIGKNGKEITIYEVKDGKITIKDKQYPIKLVDGFYIIRKLTVSECKRLQTVPDWYEFPVSDSQAYKQLGNGWTVEVIKHLLSHIPHIQEEEIEVLSMYDGMSCGQIALKELGCNVVKYTAYEIDKYAIQTTQHNFPNTIQKGDAFAVRDEDWSI